MIKTLTRVVRKERRYRRLVACTLVVFACATGLLLAHPAWLMRAINLTTARTEPFAAAPVRLAPGSMSKEYVYAGSRLLAVEEAGGGTSSLAAPGGLTAKATGVSSNIELVWDPTPGAHHYRIERADGMGPSGPDFRLLPPDAHTTNFVDTVSPHKAFLYRVRAADAAGNLSQPSNADLATSISFTEDPLPGYVATGSGAAIRDIHLIELRAAVDAVRSLTGLAPAAYTHPAPGSAKTGPPISKGAPARLIFKADVLEVRGALDEALSILGRQRRYETDPDLSGGEVKAAHFQELRDRMK